MGPSGSTKTFHLHHLALAISAKGEELPVLIEAKRYRGGDFWTVLKHGTAPLFRGEPKDLLEAIRVCGLRPVLMIDALNECSASHLSELLTGPRSVRAAIRSPHRPYISDRSLIYPEICIRPRYSCHFPTSFRSDVSLRITLAWLQRLTLTFSVQASQTLTT